MSVDGPEKERTDVRRVRLALRTVRGQVHLHLPRGQTCCQRAFLADGFKSYWRSLGNVVSKSVVDCSLMQASR